MTQIGDQLAAHMSAVTLSSGIAQQGAYICQLISSVPIYEGSPARLELFLGRLDEIDGILMSQPIDIASRKALKGFMMSRIHLELLVDMGITSDHTWEEVRELLRRRFGGIKTPLAKKGSRGDRSEARAR